jgi:hypothetical protein
MNQEKGEKYPRDIPPELLRQITILPCRSRHTKQQKLGLQYQRTKVLKLTEKV